MKRAIRALASRPAFTVIAIATLAIGFGINAAIFSITRAMLLRPLPYRDAERLVQLSEVDPVSGTSHQTVFAPLYAAWRDRVDAFEQTAGFVRNSMNVATPTFAAQVEGFRVSPSYFPMLGVAPAIGRGFTDDDARPGRDNVVLLNAGFWQRRFGGDPHIVGQTIDVDGTPCTVIGVLASFKIFHVLNRELDLFRPLVIDPNDREQVMGMWAKLRPGVSVETARTQLVTAYATLPLIGGRRWSGDVVLYQERYASGSRPTVLLLETAVAFVLLIGCANIANLLLAAAVGRRKELAVRFALGATRWHVVKDLGSESVLLTAAGLGLAIALSGSVINLLNAVVSYQDINRIEPFRLDASVVLFTFALGAGVAIAFGLLPLRTAAAVDVVDALKDSSTGTTSGLLHRGLRHGLVIAEIALAIVLASSALVLTRSASALHDISRGVAVDGVMTAQVALNDPAYADPARLVRTARAIVDRVATAPQISRAAIVNYPPLAQIRVGVPFVIEGAAPLPEGREPVTRYFLTSPGYFKTIGVPIVRGRDFSGGDDADHLHVAIVSERFAQRFWNTNDVVGRRVMPKFLDTTMFWIPRTPRGWVTIVGVVRDVNEDGIPDSAGFPQLYLPYAQAPTPVITVVAKAAGGATAATAATIRDAVRAVDPRLPVSYEMTYDDILRDTFSRPREMAWIVGSFAALALLLAAIGVYGVMSYIATARTREIGIRVALGADRSDILALIVGYALKLTIAGVAIGSVLTPLALRLARDLLFGVAPFDPWTLTIVSTVLAAVAVIASAVPALRVARAGELVALRQ